MVKELMSKAGRALVCRESLQDSPVEFDTLSVHKEEIINFFLEVPRFGGTLPIIGRLQAPCPEARVKIVEFPNQHCIGKIKF